MKYIYLSEAENIKLLHGLEKAVSETNLPWYVAKLIEDAGLPSNLHYALEVGLIRGINIAVLANIHRHIMDKQDHAFISSVSNGSFSGSLYVDNVAVSPCMDMIMQSCSIRDYGLELDISDMVRKTISKVINSAMTLAPSVMQESLMGMYYYLSEATPASITGAYKFMLVDNTRPVLILNQLENRETNMHI